VNVSSDWLDFLLVTGVTAVGVFIVAGVALWLTAWARKRRSVV
jgi:hypothetical protein